MKRGSKSKCGNSVKLIRRTWYRLKLSLNLTLTNSKTILMARSLSFLVLNQLDILSQVPLQVREGVTLERKLKETKSMKLRPLRISWGLLLTLMLILMLARIYVSN